MTKEEQNARFFSMCNIAANKYKMEIEIKDNNMINLVPIDVANWNREKDIACAIELEEAFGNNADIA